MKEHEQENKSTLQTAIDSIPEAVAVIKDSEKERVLANQFYYKLQEK